ncbi:hypothetical protein H8356DRAFT_998769 [Neocallimastix lanati (nom. inval.)]|jgi:hypothetical protein|uniref:Zinc finger CCCH domain-containing protein 14 n=1 Tax=Neocallimastix californiae TaxID=1754190 RepID=A0A1Y2D956_9FUNG|nr:hypothetical protein H8356DRAFT_998769 [Neocallimastix sp. JGI-2020a]ORY55789.1 hypothetical protein LY90DRAFT_669575 [Neocallimastix californiae]|eukprot:ORY55789.1 hypothetical protein LY90DRAFT_669575 [Neocallimastix californiae]
MEEIISIDSPVMNSKQKFNQRLISFISKKLDNLNVSYTPENVEAVFALLNKGLNKAQLTEEVTKIFNDDKDKINNSLINCLIGYSNVCCTPVHEVTPASTELKSPSIKSDKASVKAENISKTKRRVSQISHSSRNRRSIIETPVSPPPSPPKSSKASSVSSGEFEKSQKNIYHQKRLSRSATTLDITNQIQKEVMAQTMAAASSNAVGDIPLKDKDTVKKDRRRSSIRSHRTSFSSVKEEDTSRIRCQYWPSCNRGDQCKFWHPKELCKKFPNCPNGDKCLYIHPAVSSKPPSKPQSPYNRRISQSSNIVPDLSGERSAIECKYGANCTRTDCKFSHPSPALAKLNKQNIQEKSSKTIEKNSKANVPCHYYPNCKNADCPYMHPTPKASDTVNVACRYGSSCTKKDCRFLHPSSRKI